jgi:hypothetical protein
VETGSCGRELFTTLLAGNLLGGFKLIVESIVDEMRK